MSVEKVNGVNNLSNKTLRKGSPSKTRPDTSSPSRSGSTKKGAGPPSEEVASSKSDALSSMSDVVELSGQEMIEPISYKEIVEESTRTDSVEISFRDPEMVQKIKSLIEQIKARKEEISQHVEAARILLMERAYDNSGELRKTAEAILRGENPDNLDLNEL